MRKVLPVIALALVAAGCARSDRPIAAAASSTPLAAPGRHASVAVPSATTAAIRAKLARGERYAALPDRGELVAYRDDVPVFRTRAYTWKAVSLSEAHALDAIGGVMTLTAPDGHLIRLRYDHHIEHPDGNWTWIGRPAGAKPGVEAIITFGDKAVFGTIPDGSPQPLRLMAAGGRTWMVQTDASAVATLPGANPTEPDAIPVPRGAMKPAADAAAPTATARRASAAAASGSPLVDVVLGYTSGFATRLGGTSQATTRLTNMIDIANQAYANSGMSGRVRLVAAVQVNYSDTTDNDQALYDLTGYDCSGSSCVQRTVPAALQPLRDAREQYGADLVSLVRNFDNATNGSCGVGWVLGGGQVPIDNTDAPWAMSIVSDSNGKGPGSFPSNGYVCRDETLAHEMGHNMGSTHDRATSQGSNGVLDADEYGRYPYSFGYKTSSLQGNFYTVMAYGDTGQNTYRVFSNPNITSCGGFACGVANEADNARSLSQTMPIIAGFRATVVPVQVSRMVPNDFNGDGKSDLYWRNGTTGTNDIWLLDGAGLVRAATVYREADVRWTVVGSGDFNGDRKADLLWRNATTGGVFVQHMDGTTVLPSSGFSTPLESAWQPAAIADFDGDGISDIYWRNATTGYTELWLMGSVLPRARYTVHREADQNWKIVGTGDFNGDGRADVFWRNSVTGQNVVHLMNGPNVIAGSAFTDTVSDTGWKVAAVRDFDGDGMADVYWRHSGNGLNYLWTMRGAVVSTVSYVHTEPDQAWQVVNSGDYNGDGYADVFWRNMTTGQNIIHLMRGASVIAGSGQLNRVSDLSWKVTGW